MGIEDIEKEIEENEPLRQAQGKQEKSAPKRKSFRQTEITPKATVKKIRVKEEENGKEDPESRAPVPQEEFSDAEGELAVDVYQTDDEIVIQSTIAGVKPEDLDIAVERDTVTIRGERSNGVTERAKNYFHQECYWGMFSRQIILPEEVSPGGAEASMKNGILTLRLPKTERQKVKKVQVRS